MQKNEKAITAAEFAEKKVMLKKHSALIQMKNSISATQRKMYNALLFIAATQASENPEITEFKVRFADLKMLSGLENETNYKFIKDSLRALKKFNIEYNILEKDKESEWGIFGLLSEVKIRQQDEYIYFAFPPTIHKTLRRPSLYALLNLGIIANLKSKYSIALYELLEDYKNIKRLKISVEELRSLLGVEPEQYKVFTTFRNKCINTAVEEINQKTDLKIAYKMEQSGRKYTKVCFTVKSAENSNTGVLKGKKEYFENALSETEYEIIEKTPEERAEEKVISKLEFYGISRQQAKKYCKTVAHSNINDAIEILESAIESSKISNPGGYLAALLKNGASLLSPYEKEREKKKKEIIAKMEQEKNHLQADKNIKYDFEQHYNQLCNEMIKKATDEDVIQFVEESKGNKFIISHLIKYNFVDSELKPDIEILKCNQIFHTYYFDKNLPYDILFEEFVNKYSSEN